MNPQLYKIGVLYCGMDFDCKINTIFNEIFLCFRFPVDFASADIFNSSQVNNNFVGASPPTHHITNSDSKNANTVSREYKIR